MKKYIILLLILSASCQKEVGQIDEDTRALDTTAVDSLPPGYVYPFISRVKYIEADYFSRY